MKLLFYGESPLNPTGFGNVNRHLLAACARECDVTCVASTHYHASYSREEYPYAIIGCPDDGQERTMEHQRNLANIHAAIDAMDWDIFFYQGDMGWNNDILQKVGEIQQEHPEKYTIFYMPIDGDWSVGYAFDIFKWCSVPVVYTEHARSVIAQYAPHVAEYTSVIGLGTEPEIFYPLSREERAAARVKFFGETYRDRWLCINVNRNQPLKDLARSLAIFHQFHTEHPDSSLYLHSVINDAGGSLTFQAQMVGCDIFKSPAEILFSGLDLAHPWPRATLNELYNACDCLISTAYGEGWGLTTTEAMAAGIPVIVPHGTANLDILGEGQERGWGVKTGGDLDHVVYLYSNGSTIASVVHAQDFLDKLSYVWAHPEQAAEKVQAAREWCLLNTWERRESAWQQLLQMIKAGSDHPSLTTTMC